MPITVEVSNLTSFSKYIQEAFVKYVVIYQWRVGT